MQRPPLERNFESNKSIKDVYNFCIKNHKCHKNDKTSTHSNLHYASPLNEQPNKMHLHASFHKKKQQQNKLRSTFSYSY